MAKGNQELVTRLHHDGWVEANGQTLPVAQFEDLYRQLGRAWTAAVVPQDRFALPRLRDATQPLLPTDRAVSRGRRRSDIGSSSAKISIV